MHVRDWLHVSDNCSALRCLLKRGIPGQAYNISANSELVTISVVYELYRAMRSIKCDLPWYTLKYVADRVVNDKRYGMDAVKIRALGWRPQMFLVNGLKQTARWYLSNLWALENRAEMKCQSIAVD